MSVATVASEDRTSIAAVAARALPSLDSAWTALSSVADPEIPVVSVIELGIVRGVRWDADDPALVVVTITPTYSGCPATEVIAAAVRAALTAVGVARTRIETCLFPAWTTDWITPEGRRKLREFGIAPPDGLRAIPNSVAIDISGISRLRRPAVAISCPRCASKRTKLVSQFGSTACKAHYRCLDCLEPFDYFKPH